MSLFKFFILQLYYDTIVSVNHETCVRHIMYYYSLGGSTCLKYIPQVDVDACTAETKRFPHD